MYTPDRELTPPDNDGWEEKEKAKEMVDEAKFRYNSILNGEEHYKGFFGGMVHYKEDLDFAEAVLIRCENIRDKVYKYWNSL